MSLILVSVCAVLSMMVYAESANPIAIPSNGGPLFKVYIRQQNSAQIFSAGSTFNYVTGTNAAFHVTKNTLFRITFQGAAEQHVNTFIRFNLQILVNDRIISGNQLKPNSNEIDPLGGYYWYVGMAHTAVFVSRMALVYLSPGTYSFNVGVRSDFTSLQLLNGIVHYELTQFEDKYQENNLGDLSLQTIV